MARNRPFSSRLNDKRVRVGERGNKRKRRSRKAKVPRLRRSELVLDPKLRKFDFNRCSDEQFDVLLGTFKEWRNKESDEKVEASLRWYWRMLSTMAMTRFGEVYAARPVVEDMTLEELQGFAFLLASHKNIVDLTEGKSFSKSLDARYGLLFATKQKWSTIIDSTGPSFLSGLASCYLRSFKDAFGITIADDFLDGSIASVVLHRWSDLDEAKLVVDPLWVSWSRMLYASSNTQVGQVGASMMMYAKNVEGLQVRARRWREANAMPPSPEREQLVESLLGLKSILTRQKDESLALLGGQIRKNQADLQNFSEEEQTMLLTLDRWFMAQATS